VRRYTLAEITRAMDAPYADALKEPSTERAVNKFVQAVIDALKAMDKKAGQ
jgi:hypothetical protein